MRTSVKIVLTLALALSAPLSANAAEWWYVGATDRSAVFVDRESIVPVSLFGAPYAKAWDTVSGAPGAGSAYATKNVRYYNCAERMIGLKSEFGFAEDGAAAGEKLIADTAFQWRKAASDSADEMRMDFVCNAERSEGDRPDFSNAGREFVYVGDIEKAKAILTPRPGTPATRVSAKFRLGVAEGYKPIF
jgi:hypothetical protein